MLLNRVFAKLNLQIAERYIRSNSLFIATIRVWQIPTNFSHATRSC
jgi:hypothetical protein